MAGYAPIPQFELPRAVTAVLGLIAGYVDAFTFLGLYGFFIAQLTGSFVYVGVGLASGSTLGLAQLLALPVFFLAGVVTTLMAEFARRFGRAPLAWALGLECLLLTGMTATSIAGEPFDSSDRLPGLVVAMFGIAAMGVQSAHVRLMIKGAPSTNVMTTNTTLLAIDATELLLAFCSRGRRGDADSAASATVGRRLLAVILPMLGFFLGTCVGAVAYVAIGFVGLVAPLAVLIALWIWVIVAKPGKPAR